MAVSLNRQLKLGVLVHEVSRLRRKAIDQLVRPLEITGSQWWVLTYISLRPGLSQVRLAEVGVTELCEAEVRVIKACSS